MANRWGNSGNNDRLYFWGAPKSLQMVTAAMKLKDACSLEENYEQPRQQIKKERHYFAYKGPSSKAMVFPVVMYVCESGTIKKTEHQKVEVFELWCWTRLLGVPWTARRSNQSILKENSPEYSLEGRMLKLKLPILWPPDTKNWLIWKDPDAGKDWKQEEKDGMVGWHHRLNGHEFE